jgi:hypothetical protein
MILIPLNISSRLRVFQFQASITLAYLCLVSGVAAQISVENINAAESSYANKITGVIFRRDVETFPSCLGLLDSGEIGSKRSSIEALAKTITQCKSQTYVYEEGKSIVRLFFEAFCGKAKDDWPKLPLKSADVEFACRLQEFGIGLNERLKLIQSREQNHRAEIRWLEECLRDRRRGGVCR